MCSELGCWYPKAGISVWGVGGGPYPHVDKYFDDWMQLKILITDESLVTNLESEEKWVAQTWTEKRFIPNHPPLQNKSGTWFSACFLGCRGLPFALGFFRSNYFDFKRKKCLSGTIFRSVSDISRRDPTVGKCREMSEMSGTCREHVGKCREMSGNVGDASGGGPILLFYRSEVIFSLIKWFWAELFQLWSI